VPVAKAKVTYIRERPPGTPRRLGLRLVVATVVVELLYFLGLLIAIPIGPLAVAITFALALSLAIAVALRAGYRSPDGQRTQGPAEASR
jgi:hypothetical protein